MPPTQSGRPEQFPPPRRCDIRSREFVSDCQVGTMTHAGHGFQELLEPRRFGVRAAKGLGLRSTYKVVITTRAFSKLRSWIRRRRSLVSGDSNTVRGKQRSSIAKAAMARKLAVRLYWMWRKEWDYKQVKRFGFARGPANLLSPASKSRSALSPWFSCSDLYLLKIYSAVLIGYQTAPRNSATDRRQNILTRTGG